LNVKPPKKQKDDRSKGTGKKKVPQTIRDRPKTRSTGGTAGRRRGKPVLTEKGKGKKLQNVWTNRKSPVPSAHNKENLFFSEKIYVLTSWDKNRQKPRAREKRRKGNFLGGGKKKGRRISRRGKGEGPKTISSVSGTVLEKEGKTERNRSLGKGKGREGGKQERKLGFSLLGNNRGVSILQRWLKKRKEEKITPNPDSR